MLLVQHVAAASGCPPVLRCAAALLAALRGDAAALVTAGAAVGHARLHFEADWLSLPPDASTVPVSATGAAIAELRSQAMHAPPWALRVLPAARAAVAPHAAAAGFAPAHGDELPLTLRLQEAGAWPPPRSGEAGGTLAPPLFGTPEQGFDDARLEKRSDSRHYWRRCHLSLIHI